VAIDLTCRCGKQFSVNDKVAGTCIPCPACAVAIDVPTFAALKPGPPPLPKDLVRGAPPARSRPAKPPRRPDAPAASSVHRFVGLWLAIAAVVPVAIVSVVFGLYLLLTRTPAAVVADKGPDNAPALQQGGPPLEPPPPAKVKLKTNVHPQAKPPAQPRTEAQANLAQRVHDMFKANCHRCHGQDGENEGGLNYVVDLRTLVSRNKVVPGKPDDSLVFQRMTAKSRPMPPRSEKVRPTDAEIAALKQWIEDGAPSLESAADDREFIADADIVQHIHDDLQKVEERSRRFTRYFTITHLYNAGRSEDELQTFRLALSKLVNSLSWERDIEVPRPIDPARTIVRVDLRHYQWTPEVWKRVLGEYPYAVKRAGATARAVYAATDCDMPYARADWFVFAASRPPLYHDILEMPLTDRELERRLAVDADANIRNEKVARAGFNSSGVSSNNRLVERHRSGYGAYWKSYDFANNQDRKNLFAFPLGPSTTASSFQHDGGEIIFSLPNGLQGYFLTDARGNRIDKGPTTIVRDDRQPDRAVVNGVSCMSCHAQGMIEKADQVREHVGRNAAGFTPDVVATILALYPPRDRFAALLKEDAERFAAAVKKTGAHLSTTEPIAALATRYTQELDLPLAAAETGLDVETFLKTLQVSPQLARTLGPLSAPGGTVQRDVYVASFGELARLLMTPGTAASAPQPGLPATNVPGDIFTFIDSEVKANRVKHQEAGWTLFKQVKDMPAEPSILIGFNALKKKGPFDHLIAGLQPIYLTRTGEKTGPWIGNSATEPIVLKAKPGYVVGALHIKTASTFDAFAVTFVRFEGGRIVASDNYASPWIGGSKGNTATVGGPGALIVGFSGHVNQGGDLNAVGALSIRTKE
jgi:cytochrome c553